MRNLKKVLRIVTRALIPIMVVSVVLWCTHARTAECCSAGVSTSSWTGFYDQNCPSGTGECYLNMRVCDEDPSSCIYKSGCSYQYYSCKPGSSYGRYVYENDDCDPITGGVSKEWEEWVKLPNCPDSCFNNCGSASNHLAKGETVHTGCPHL